MKKEEFEELINSIKGKVNETDSALISEDLLGIVGNYYSALDRIDEVEAQNEKLEKDNKDLIMANGRLFQKIGFQKEEVKYDVQEQDEDEEIRLEDIIDEKGEYR